MRADAVDSGTKVKEFGNSPPPSQKKISANKSVINDQKESEISNYKG